MAIATPVGTHSKIALAAIDAGKDVLIEKPLTDSLESGRRLVEHARSVRAILMVDHTFCYTSSVRYIRDLVAAATWARSSTTTRFVSTSVSFRQTSM